MMGYLTQDREGKRILKFQPHPSYMAKLRQPVSGAQIPLIIDNPSMVDILASVRQAHPKQGG